MHLGRGCRSVEDTHVREGRRDQSGGRQCWTQQTSVTNGESGACLWLRRTAVHELPHQLDVWRNFPLRVSRLKWGEFLPLSSSFVMVTDQASGICWFARISNLSLQGVKSLKTFWSAMSKFVSLTEGYILYFEGDMVYAFRGIPLSKFWLRSI